MKNFFLAFLMILVGTTLSVAQSYPELIKVTGGSFTMGDEHGLGGEDEQPTHQVTLTDYFIGKTEVTVSQYRTYCNDTGVSMPEAPDWGWNDNDPIVNVNWNDAINYCDWLSEKLDKNITLPTEAQWEYAARGGNQSQGYKYSGGRSMATAGWFADNSGGKAHPVATKKANELGLYDMSGNVWEWCLDWYDSNYYANSPSKNPKNTTRSDYKVIRGGSWYYAASRCRAANRSISGDFRPDGRSSVSGFRVVSF
jgi:formylglycine-generating enzyme required for sulfatase activity